MRDEQQQQQEPRAGRGYGQPQDGAARRADAPASRRFARNLDCGSGGEGGRPAWPAARAPGAVRDGDATTPDAA